MRASQAHIAGIGTSSFERSGTKQQLDATLHELAVSAGTKALLDAGVTYNDVDQCVACFFDDSVRIPRSCFDTFGKIGTSISEVDNRSGLFTAIQCIKSLQADCAIVIGLDKELDNSASNGQVLVVGIVLVSQKFLTSHAYLKDSAIHIRACTLMNGMHSRSLGGSDQSRTIKTAVQNALRQAHLQPGDIQILEVRTHSNSSVRQALDDFRVTERPEVPSSLAPFSGGSGLAGLCGIVWQLRGWSHAWPGAQVRNCLQFTSHQDGTANAIVLGRSNGAIAPSWETIENLRDGRERLGYNPAVEMRGISQEDLDAVKAREEFTLEDAVKKLQLPVKGGDRAALARL